MEFEKEIDKLLSLCGENDIDLYLVGGATRDYLVNKKSYDLDFCLTSDYNHACYILNKEYKIKCDDKYQSIKFELGKYNIEISHARKENEYLDYRHPSSIEFTNDIKEDSKRRDFTINAIYYRDGEFYDFYSGIDDLNNNKLKVIGDTITRFKEDPLRILRMIRFFCHGFNINNSDKRVILDNGYLLKELTITSFNKEFEKILDINNVNVINEYKEIFEEYFDVKFNDLSRLKDLITLDEKRTYLGIKNKSSVYKYKDVIIKNDKEYLTKLIYKIGKEIVKELVEYHDRLYSTKIIDLYKYILDNSFYSKTQLEISSKEIINIVNKKELTSYYLDMISYAIIEGKLENKKEKIIHYILEKIK